MKRIFTILSLALCLALISCGVGRTPKSTTMSFFRAIEAGEYVEALELTTLGDEGDTELYCAIMDKERKSIAEKGGIAKVEILSVNPSMEDENRATITTLLTYGNGTTHEEVCEMVKIDNRWKIDVNLNTK
ncbi:MAG: DUF4878 domain-containing protein [Rikenellaceae bacterium]|nr:DUF4878 domain-containing protein [Rikenellaceae bacterium]